MIIAIKKKKQGAAMDKHLFIIRHAKSDWSFEVGDFDRPLNARGFNDAPFMAQRLAGHRMQPGLLVSSPAKRALTTAQIFAAHLHVSVKDIQVDERIYEADTGSLLHVINEIDNRYDHAALFGHNPGLTSLVNNLANEYIANMPTCSIAHIHFEHIQDWASVSGGLGQMVWFAYPKDQG